MLRVKRHRSLSAKRGLLALAAAFLVAASSEPAETFGIDPTLSEVTPLASLLARPEQFDAQTLLLRGEIHEVCQKKGCWTILRDGEAFVRVRFQDYGFFLPKDSRGRIALAQGQVTVRTLSEREAKHYASETAGGDPDAIEGPQHEVGFLATGVRFEPAR